MSDIRNGMSISDDQRPRAALMQTAAAPNNTGRQYKANGEFKPDTLRKDASAGQYEFWKRQFRRYYTTSNMDLAPIEDQRGHLKKCVDALLGTALTGDREINEDTRIWPREPGCTINCIHALDKLFLKNQLLADRRRAIFHCKQAIGQKMSQLIAEKENERFTANTADMTQDDHFVIAILEMCTDPELSKRFREVKADELTWKKLKDVAEVYERTTASDNRAMLVNSNRKNWKKEPECTDRQHETVLAVQQKRTCLKRVQNRQRQTLLQIL